MKTRQRDISGQSNRLNTVLLLGLVGGGLGFSPCYSQSQAPESDQPLQEVVITAEKRESTVQKTPFSITAVSSQQMEARGLSTVEDVAAGTAGLSMRSSGPGQTEYDMRGLTSSGGSSATTGLYLNEVPLAAPAASFTGHVSIDPDLFDLNRVEVLRGPQGTLYGAGSMGGTIRLVLNQPKMNEFEGAAQGIVGGMSGGGPSYGGSVMLNLPLVDDRLALRVVGTDKYTDGWIDRVVAQPFPVGPTGDCGWASCTRGDVAAAPVTKSFERSNWERLTGARGSLLFKPMDGLSIDLLAMYQKIEMGGFSEVDDPPGPGQLSHYQPFDIAEPFTDIFKIFAATVNYDLGFATLTSSTSHWRRDTHWTGDISENFQNYVATAYGFTPLVSDPYYNDNPSQQTSEELRLTSASDGKFQWVAGGFFDRFRSAFTQYVANEAYTQISTGGAEANPLGIIYKPFQPYYITQYAAFAEGSYQILDALKATVGIRWYHYTSQQNSEQLGVFTVSGNATPSFASVASSQSGTNPKVNLSYTPTRDLTVYVQAAKGFRPGGVNIPAPPACTFQPSPAYQPDSLWDYEAGEKVRFLDGRLTVNADFYYIVWKNIQEQLNQTCGFPYTANAGTAVSYGPELEVHADVTHRLAVSLSGTYTQAYLKDVAAGGLGTIGAATAVTPGLRLNNVPHYTVNATATYGIPVSNSYEVRATVIASVIGPQNDISYYTQELPGYTLVNARVGLTGGNLVPYLYVNNLANRYAVTGINTQAWSLATPAFDRDTITTPRTFGLELRYKF
jgi:iron complex outermembrane recepter protein